MRQRLLIVTLFSLLCASCAQKPVAPAAAAPVKGEAAQAAANIDSALARAAALPSGTPSVVADPTLVSFEKMSVKLSPAAEAQVNALASGLVVAKSITVLGYCNRKEVGNAKAAATARAEAVKTLLVKAGIPESRIKMRTDIARPIHAVRITFSG